MDGDDGGALVGLEVALSRAPFFVEGQGGRSQNVQDGVGGAQPSHLPEVGCLGPFVGYVGLAVAHPIVSEAEQP